MRAARFHEHGEADTLVIEQAPEPHSGPGQIRIRVAAAGVNPIDWKVRSGALRAGTEPADTDNHRLPTGPQGGLPGSQAPTRPAFQAW
ncbi:hypothetical protein SAMN05421505_10953 [Sinosporangium album]|uniref:NADPH2:quinone reductase n=1 Tax=Sinosporangium album TaxID=504805 RepID=A0A1G7Y0I0_9ACTN|nr:hypothetical protein [Sinosporangium album]SDG89897.1 hypothetical protein SAMN05421505_10953 [Sinosporangium album]